MARISLRERSVPFKIGFGILFFFTAGNVVGQIGLLLTHANDRALFLGWAAFNGLGVAILLFAYRHGEKWAWYALWALVVPYALVILVNRVVGPIYLGEALAMAGGQALAYRDIFVQR